MTTYKEYKNIRLICCLCLILSGCATVPSAPRPLEIEHACTSSFDKTWEAIHEIAVTSKGNIITEDKASGVIVYSMLDDESKSKVYMQVFVKTSANDKGKVLVYLFPRDAKGYYSGKIQDDFFKKLKNVLGD